MTHVNASMSRDEVLKTFVPLLHDFGQGPAPVATKAEAADLSEAREIVERAASYTVESIVKCLADLQVDLGGAIDGLAEQIGREASKLGDLRRALGSESRRLGDLRSICVAAEALEILLQDHKQKAEVLEARAHSERHDLSEKINKQREAWRGAEAERTATRASVGAAQARERKAKEEQYTYEVERQRKLSADELAEKQRLLARTLAETEATREKSWGEREAALAAASREIEALRERAAATPKQLEEESRKARERAIARVTSEAKHEADLQEREGVANIEVFELKVAALDERIARQLAQVSELQRQLGTALEQGQSLAHKAIEGTSGGRK